MSVSYKADHNFGQLKKADFSEGESPYSTWRESQNVGGSSEVDVLEHLRFNIEQLNDLNSRFQFLLEELSNVLIKK